jgi:hypothetical protein
MFFFFCKLCNYYLSYILQAYVLVLYIFTNVSQTFLGDFAFWICTIMELDTHWKPIQNFPNFFMPSFFGLNLLLCGVFQERGSFFTNAYELPIAFPHQKIIIQNFQTWKVFSSNFLITIWERPSTISQGNIQCLLRVSQTICFNKWFYFLPWVFKG